MRAVSLFSGIGGLDVAVQHVFGCRFVAHVEQDGHCQRVLSRHWPDVPCHDDVRTVGVAELGAVDLICGGFPCTDISVAGKGAGLDGESSGLWYEYLRIVREIQPAVVVVENTPRLYRKWEWRREVELPLRSLGYRVEWTLCRASDAGAPHGRERCFMLAARPDWTPCLSGKVNVIGGGMHAATWPTPVAADSGRGSRTYARGNPTLRGAAEWPTPTAAIGTGGQTSRSGDRKGELLLAGAVKQWPTPTSCDAKGSGSRCLDSNASPAISLTDAVRPDRVTERSAPAPSLPLDWPTPSARAYRSGKGHVEGQTHPGWRGTADLPEMLGGTLNPEWVEQLQGLPRGWTAAEGDAQTVDLFRHKWPAPRDKALGAATPQHDSEAPRLCAPRTVPNRTSRLRALGNAVVPQQAVLALHRLINQHRGDVPQGRLFT